jgi:hypothetical protein
MQVLRISLTGGSAGPDLMLTIEVISPKEASARIQNFIQQHPVK